jgi:uncharacterized protein (DUF305 family)
MKQIVPRIAMLALLSAGAAAAQVTQPAHADSARRVGYGAADVRFLQRMMGHHAQALVMTALVPARSRRPEVRMLALRIEQTQQAEIAQMTRWLARRGERVPPAAGAQHAHDMTRMDSASTGMAGMAMGGAMPAMPGMPGMPGMLTEAQLAALAAASGPAFDRLFLQDMIGHHEGALTMVAELLTLPGAAQEPELDRMASDVDADQRAEIARMRALLGSLPHD